MDFTTMSNDDLAAALAEKRTAASTIFALTEPTIEQVNEAETLVASIGEIEAEQTTRAAAVKEAAERFAAARATFSQDEEETEEEFAVEDGGDDTEEIEAPVEDEGDEDEPEADEAEDQSDEAEAVTTASVNHTTSQTIKAGARKAPTKTTAAAKVGARAKRPAVKAASPVTITAAADVPGIPAGAPMADLEAVAKAVQSRVKGFAPFNKRAAEMARSASGGSPVLNKFGVASFGVDFASEQVATAGNDYAAVKFAQERHREVITASMNGTQAPGGDGVLTAAGWCAPSENVYTWLADYVVDGLVTIPEVSAPRGGLNITTGPALAQGTLADVDNFGFGGTEAEAIADTFNKTCEVIECPEFEDHRLDFVGYCWKIPFLTQAAYPELVTDALRLSNVLYAHKLNRRFIGDLVAESTAVDATGAGFGSSQFDTLEALTIVAVKERRWWNLGENATMEVKVPQWAREVFIFDMAKRSGLALSDMANEAKVNAHFAAHNLAVEYVSDYQDIHGSATPTVDWPNTMKALIYPVGTFVKAVEDVVNLSAVYDAASLSANEYTGVFFEQGVMTVKMGYRSHEVTVPVCTAGATGANSFECAPGTSF